jgi:hypothetical protein
MAKIHVTFERTHGAGLHFSSIKVNDELLTFEDDKAAKSLEVGEPFELYWRIQGNEKSKLTIKYTADGAPTQSVESTIPARRSRHSAFTFILL